jgi:hypothetical protein
LISIPKQETTNLNKLKINLQKKSLSIESLSHIGNSPSGKAPDSESGIGGSNPSFPTIKIQIYPERGILIFIDAICGFETVATLMTKESGKSQLNLAFCCKAFFGVKWRKKNPSFPTIP